MGKSEEEQALYHAAANLSVGCVGAFCFHCSSIRRLVNTKCLLVMLLGVAVLISALFLLPPFFKDRRAGEGNWGTGIDGFGADIIASFRLQRSVAEVKQSIAVLQNDIYEEIGVPNSSVVIISILPLGGSNWSDAVFGVLPYLTDSAISSAGLSIIKSYFESFVVKQSTLQLNPSLFGNTSFFQVLEFPGGITIIPPQKAFLLQKVQITFNFTLNFSIYQVQHKMSELKDQMRTGLHLSSNENLYVSLTNMLGSTMSSPTIVQTSILPAVGTPTKSRLKELAKAITGSPAKNLGLNHTVFGRVKQVHLSSFLQLSLNGSNGHSASSSPSPTQPDSAHHHGHHHHHHHHHHQQHHHHHHHHHHHYHHHHHQQHHHENTRAPCPSMPTLQPNYQAPSSGQHFGNFHKSRNKSHIVPTAAPGFPPDPSPSRPPDQGPSKTSPLPEVSFANVQPPSKSTTQGKSSYKPLASSCCFAKAWSVKWGIVAALYMLMQVHL